MTAGISLINYVTRIQFGYGAASTLEGELDRLDVRRPLLVTDKGVIAAGLVGMVPRKLPWHACYDVTPSNPTEAAVRQAAAIYVDAGCDGVVALGGGSPIDLAKGIALAVTHEGPLIGYALAHGGMDRITARTAPVIAVPTTSGTGSEVARATVVIMADGAKRVIASPFLVPRAAICDPELTLTQPPGLTAAVGFDAIAHCVETFCSPVVNPPAEAIALDGLERALANIEQAVRDGTNRDARWHMMMASLQGGMAFQKGLGAVHALSHPLGELGLHHGTLNAVLLPSVLRRNEAFIGPKLARIGEMLALTASESFADHLARLMARLSLPSSLSQLGVRRDCIADIARKAAIDTCSATNPAPLGVADYEELLATVLR
jgi:4-hydroxybutyrate dehydrogenase